MAGSGGSDDDDDSDGTIRFRNTTKFSRSNIDENGSCVNWGTWQYSLRDGISPVELIAVANARSKLKTNRT